MSEPDERHAAIAELVHDIRNHLNAVLGFAQILLLDELPEVQHDRIEQVRLSAEHATEGIDALVKLVLDKK